jgi:hypothetical protein
MRSRTVAFLVVPPVEELDLVGPLEVFTGANRVLAERGLGTSRASSAPVAREWSLVTVACRL